MKKIFLIILALAFALALASCGKSDYPSGAQKTDPSIGATQPQPNLPINDESSTAPESYTKNPDAEKDVNYPTLESYTGKLDSQKYDEIKRAYAAKTGYEPEFVYYGTYGDAVVLYEDTAMTAIGEIVVCDVVIRNHNIFSLLVYNGGTFCDAQSALHTGLLEYDDIVEIARLHIIYHNSITGWNTPFDECKNLSGTSRQRNVTFKYREFVKAVLEKADPEAHIDAAAVAEKYNAKLIGVYNGCAVVEVPNGILYDMISYDEAFGYKFNYGMGQGAVCIKCENVGENGGAAFVSLTEAAQKGILNEREIGMIFSTYWQRYLDGNDPLA